MRGSVRTLRSPSARTQADCEQAAVALLDDAEGKHGWADCTQFGAISFRDRANDIFPGDGLAVNVPSQGAVFNAIVRKINIDCFDPANDRGMNTIEFANDLAAPLSFQIRRVRQPCRCRICRCGFRRARSERTI